MKDLGLKHELRHLPDGTCLNCGQQKMELKDDPENPNKPKWIWCDECYDKIQKENELKGKYMY